MDTSEYLAFVPLLLYGIALGDLLTQWRRFFRKEYFYWPYFLTTIMFTEWAIVNVFDYNQVVQDILGSVEYSTYLLLLVQPMIYMVMVSALTPESAEVDTKAHFAQRMSIVFTLSAVFILVQALPYFGIQYNFDPVSTAAIAICVAIAVTQKVWLVNLLGVIWLVGLLYNIGVINLN